MRFFFLLVILLSGLTTKGQLPDIPLGDNRNLYYRTPVVPQTFCFATKGELKLHFARQLYYPETDWHKDSPFLERVGITLSDMWLGNAHDPNVTISYTPTSNFALSAGYIKTFRWDYFFVGTNFWSLEYDTHYHGETESLTVSGAYHNTLTDRWAYEVGTGLAWGSGSFEFTEELPGYIREKSTLKYQMLTHNFRGSLSYRYRKMQVTGQINTGYVRYFSINYGPVLPGTVEHVVNPFLEHQTDFYIDPALLVSFNFSRFGWHLHYSFPYAHGQSKLSKPVFNIGVGMSFKILKGSK